MAVAWLLGIAALIEAATGAALIFDPNLVARLLLGEGLFGAGLPVARVAGVALIALGAAGWIGQKDKGRHAALAAMLTYNVLVAAYLCYLGLDGALSGPLLWPAAAFHAALGLLLAVAWQARRSRSGT